MSWMAHMNRRGPETITPEFMIRVKLPNPAGYHSGPSGDTDYEEAHRKAMEETIPEGFKVIKERLEVSRPMDSAGFTYVRIKCTDQDRTEPSPQDHALLLISNAKLKIAEAKLEEIKMMMKAAMVKYSK